MRLPPDLEELLASVRSRWLVTGAAGFIGSNILEALLRRGQMVRGFDNFSTGRRANLEMVRSRVSPEEWCRFEFVEGDIREPASCARAAADVEVVLHQAALGSVPGSLRDPALSHAVNVTGSLNLLLAAREARVQRMVYASSCAIYGDQEELPLGETLPARPLSPYAATKVMNELYAAVVEDAYGLPCVGLRYFNVYGPRQDPSGPYAAVIPAWLGAILQGRPVVIYGDGESSRDFCFVADVVQANLRAALGPRPRREERVFNVACGERISLNRLFELLKETLADVAPEAGRAVPIREDFRPGDVRHSMANLDRARAGLGFAPLYGLAEGLRESLPYYLGLYGRG